MSRRRAITVPGLEHPGQPIPVATSIGGWVFSSPVGPRDPATGGIPERLDDQLALTFANLGRILDAAGLAPADVADVSVLLADRADRARFNDYWTAFFGSENAPARQVLQGDLPEGARVLLRFVAAEP